MFKYLSKKIKEIIVIQTPPINKPQKEDTFIEFEIPENAQYNPRIPDLVHGKYES